MATEPSYTIPLRTPFALTGSATDADGDTLTYMWEQNDRGGISGGSTAGTALVNNVKTNGPLFRQFGTAANVSADRHAAVPVARPERRDHRPDARVPGHRPDPRRQHECKERSTCPAAPPAPAVVPDAVRDCYSEFLPTADWVGFAR